MHGLEDRAQLGQRLAELDLTVKSAVNRLDPAVVTAENEWMLLSQYLRLTDENIHELKGQTRQLNADAITEMFKRPGLLRFIRLGETVVTIPNTSDYSHAQCSVVVFGLKMPNDAGTIHARHPNTLMIFGGSSSIGIEEDNSERPLTASLIQQEGRALNPPIEVKITREEDF